MSAHPTLFEVSWEVCNKVGGIHTVVSTKAKTLVGKLGDEYVAIGPWLLSGGTSGTGFEEERGFEAFCESCRALGVPVRVGRWKIPGRPRTILVEFSGLFAKKDQILARLWEHYKVDSLFGTWDYVEPLMFGHAAGLVIERWWQERNASAHKPAVAQFHEWMTGSGLLYLKERVPEIGTVFTTHATVLGRSVSSAGIAPEQALAGKTSEDLAQTYGVRAKHSIESSCAREADVFTTVSQITCDEAERFFGRKAAPVLPNGIDLDVIDELGGRTTRAEAAKRLRDLAHRFLGEDVADARLLCISGRYEFHNKGIDLLLDALGKVNAKEGRRVVLFALVPAGNSGLRREVHERLKMDVAAIDGPIGLSTHNLFDTERDPLHQHCRKLELDNRRGARVRVIQVPVYLGEGDGIFELPYEAILRGMDLTCFPSFYEPWGYTPQESLAVGVPTITSDCAGFGRFSREAGLTWEHGMHVLSRVGVDANAAADALAGLLEVVLSEEREQADVYEACRKTARLTAWTDLIGRYEEAFRSALQVAEKRAPGRAFRPRAIVPVTPAPQRERPHLVRFEVAATMPRALAGLTRLARNLWWSWDPDATELFREVFPRKWDSHRHNPVSYLRGVYPEDLAARAIDPDYTKRLEQVLARFDAYMAEKGKPHDLGLGHALDARHPVAYFCAEFGIHESLRVYSGGLGILAGDHLKSASDLNLPMVAVGLFYRMGYVKQRLTASGEQISSESENDPRSLPMDLVLDEHGKPLEIVLQLPSSSLVLRAWKVAVGRVDLYLLDSNVEANRPEDRDITRQLYGGDQELRLRQEIVLGRGGKRLLARLGLEPAVYHVNEGHAAFLVLERVSHLVRDLGLTFEEAREAVRATTVFTTHTPVPAGHDRFGEDLMRRYFSDAPSWVGVPWERFFALGQADEDRGSFNMTYLALAFSGFANGVSQLHGRVSQKLLQPFWPKLLESEIPVEAVTNGVHLASWIDPALRALLGISGRTVTRGDFTRDWNALDGARLVEIRHAARRRMLAHVRERLEQSFHDRHDSPAILHRMLDGLSEDALWLGFARRFAPYKRAQLLFRDLDRLAAIVSDEERPVRIVFAGKAHPQDRHGQEILKQVAAHTRVEPFLGRVFFVEDHDIELARHLVQGVDVWINNPIRPLEASGTSGMKVAANGGLNLSVLDGWWIEAFEGSNGWAVGGGRVYPNQELQDELDGENLYHLIEEEVVPLYFARDEKGLPQEWLARVRRTLATIPAQFSTDRMVEEYRDRAYAPLALGGFELAASNHERGRELVQRHARIRKGFADVRIAAAHIADLSAIQVGDAIDVRVEVHLGALAPDDLLVDLVLGHAQGERDLNNRVIVPLTPNGPLENGLQPYAGSQRMQRSGSFAYGIRVRARPASRFDLALYDLVLWA
jgi:phosphorylase/glycogen(starch) synthase